MQATGAASNPRRDPFVAQPQAAPTGVTGRSRDRWRDEIA
jgi:hypothetical protein